MGILTSSTKERLEALEEQRKELQARIAEERLAKPKMKEEFVRFWLLRFRKLDMTQPEQRQALVDTFINAIYLYDDKVLITFNYKEGTETVAFGEAVKAEKSSDMSARGAPQQQNPNFFPIGEGFGFFVFFYQSFNRFLIISLDVLICRYSPLLRAFPALFISEEPHKSFYYPSCFHSQK